MTTPHVFPNSLLWKLGPGNQSAMCKSREWELWLAFLKPARVVRGLEPGQRVQSPTPPCAGFTYMTVCTAGFVSQELTHVQASSGSFTRVVILIPVPRLPHNWMSGLGRRAGCGLGELPLRKGWVI